MCYNIIKVKENKNRVNKLGEQKSKIGDNRIEMGGDGVSKIILQRKDRKLIDSIFEYSGNIFGVHFVGYEDVVWCKSISEIYIALEQFKKNSFVKTDENAELVV